MSLLLLNIESLGRWVVPMTFLRMPNLIFCLLSNFVAIFIYLQALIFARTPFIELILLIPHSSRLLFASSLTSFLTNNFTHIADTFTLVRLGLTQTADLGGHLADQLLVDTFQRDRRI